MNLNVCVVDNDTFEEITVMRGMTGREKSCQKLLKTYRFIQDHWMYSHCIVGLAGRVKCYSEMIEKRASSSFFSKRKDGLTSSKQNNN